MMLAMVTIVIMMKGIWCRQGFSNSRVAALGMVLVIVVDVCSKQTS